MNIAEILRGLADKLETISGQEQGHHPMQQAELNPVDVDNTDNTESDLMIPPLQQKLELLKKAAGEESAYDDAAEHCDTCDCDPCECNVEQDPLDAMKKMAGLPVAIQVSSEDNDIEG
jgi:hypothetical protein